MKHQNTWNYSTLTYFYKPDIYIYKPDLALDNLQWLICHKTKPKEQIQISTLCLIANWCHITFSCQSVKMFGKEGYWEKFSPPPNLPSMTRQLHKTSLSLKSNLKGGRVWLIHIYGSSARKTTYKTSETCLQTEVLLEVSLVHDVRMRVRTHIHICACGVMDIFVGNEHDDTSSNPGRGWLHFTLH